MQFCINDFMTPFEIDRNSYGSDMWIQRVASDYSITANREGNTLWIVPWCCEAYSRH